MLEVEFFTRCSSLVAFCLFLVTFYFFLVAYYFLLVTRYFLLVARYFLFVTCHFLLVARYFLFIAYYISFVARSRFFRIFPLLKITSNYFFLLHFLQPKVHFPDNCYNPKWDMKILVAHFEKFVFYVLFIAVLRICEEWFLRVNMIVLTH